ncbi:hypothetical protein HU200_062210 [Digitaria exilis]|uniref:RNase H type-1 domain-containing protein n=1 Tax=Digitaria exilis TaxID=1010633 RepID=A0A835A986_9POAL|nr:hypothetical protein HU200_062210 [Digitaria exilis]
MREHWELPAEDDLVQAGLDWLLLLLDRYASNICDNFLMLIWRCWNVRNSVVMAGERVSVDGSVAFLSRYMVSLLQIRQQGPLDDVKGKHKVIKRWAPPMGDVLKINVDGAFIVETGAAAVGVVIRNKDGTPLLMACRKVVHCRDAEEIEALACLEGSRMGARWADCSFILESDNASVIVKLKMREWQRSNVAPVILDTLHAKAELGSLAFAKIGREQNKVAHELAHLALRKDVNCVWFAQIFQSA